MKVLYDPHDQLDFSQFGIAIPIGRDNAARTIEVLLNEAGSLSTPGWLIQTLTPGPTREDLLRVHTPRFVDALFAGGSSLEAELMGTFELILADGSYNRYDPTAAVKPLTELFAALLQRGGGTIGAGELALQHGAAMYMGGGFHHAMADFGEGFCLYNDVMVAIRRLQSQGSVANAWVVDVDAHKGDGTAALTQNDPTVASFSIHMASGWPLDVSPEQARLAPDRSELSFLPSTLDIGIESGQEGDYNRQLTEALEALWAHRGSTVADATGRPRLVPHPDLVYVHMGADPFEEDELPSTQVLKLTREQMHQRDQIVHRFFRERNVPIAYVMAGNYGEAGWKIYSDFLRWALGY